MPIIISKGIVFISIKEVIKYFKGMKEDLENQHEWNKKQVEKQSLHPELTKIIHKIDKDNFEFITQKINNAVLDLQKTLDKAFTNHSMKKKKQERKCEKCGIKYKSGSSLFSLVKLDGLYHSYCKGCVIFELNFLDRKITGLKGNWSFKNSKDLKGLLEVININLLNYVFSNPEIMNKIKKSKPYKNMMEKFKNVK